MHIVHGNLIAHEMNRMKSFTFHTAVIDDKPVILQLLKENHLPYEDISDSMLQEYRIAKEKNLIIGCIGIQRDAEFALLRSFCIQNSYRNLGIGKTIYSMLENECKSNGIKELYLLTSTAESFFLKRGFLTIDRTNAPEFLKNSSEFQYVCPTSAICMKKII